MAIDVKELSSAGTIKEQGAAKPAKPGQSRIWLYNPVIDLAIGCAGWSAPLLMLLYLSAGSGVAGSIVFYGLALLFNYPHYMATIYRAYRTREDFSRYRIFTLHLTLVIVLAGAIAHWSPSLIPWVFTLYITWSPWHYSGQNFGLALMFARRSGSAPTRAERSALFTAFVASYGILFLTMHSGVSMDPYVLSLGLPVGLTNVIRAILACVFVLTGPWALVRLARRGGWRTIVAPATLFGTQFLWFVVPFFLQLALKVEIPQTRYSTGILAFMHSAQYLWITSYYARREAIASGVQRWRPRAYFAYLILGGIVLFIPGPWLISYGFHYDFTSSFLIFTAIVNIHHFLLDGAIWKLREGRIANLLISSPAKLTSSLWGLARWGTRRSVRAFVVAAAVCLVLFAALDQARFFLSANSGKMSSLERAERLNPYDSTVHATLARAETSSGDTDAAVSEFQRAVNLNPYSPDTRAEFIKLLVSNNRYQEAYDEYKRLAPFIKRDPDSLLNFGILASSQGHPDEAIESWEQTLALAPDTKSAHLYLADALYTQGKHAEAVPHYERYLALAASAHEGNMDAQVVFGIAMRLGDAYADLKNSERAIAFYREADGLAERAGAKSLESLVLEHTGNLYVAAGNNAQAAEFFRSALHLDADSTDEQAAGLDWFSYAQFLNDASVSKDMVLACALKAETMWAATPGKELDLIKQYREQIEKALGNDAAQKARQDRDALVEQALKVKL
jgi:tetratricopeptide (TPR) repeat protein